MEADQLRPAPRPKNKTAGAQRALGGLVC